MNHKLAIFENPEFGKIRTIETEDGKVLFCGADIAGALGYSNKADVIMRHCKEKGIVKHDTLTNGGVQALTYIDNRLSSILECFSFYCYLSFKRST